MPDKPMTDAALLQARPDARSRLLALLSGSPSTRIQRMLRQSTLRATAVFALSGLAFAVGNLLLARTMPVEAYGQLALAIALFNVFGLLAPMGVDQAMLRHHIDPGPRLLAFLSASGIVLGVIVGAGYSVFNDLHVMDGIVLALVIAAGGVTAALVSLARSRHREAPALLLATAASWVLLATGIASMMISMHSPLLPLALFALGNLLAAAIGWTILGKAHRIAPEDRAAIPWGEACSLLGIAAIGTVILQLERLVIPPTIGISALALFSVLASVAIFPFRLLTASAGFALVPKLRAASSHQEKRQLVKRELLSTCTLLAGATIGIVLLAPIVTPLLTGGRYEIGLGLAMAACFNGYGKVMQSFPRALITACGSDQEIARLNRLGWIGLVTSIAGAFAGAHWGLIGLLYGVTLGSMAGTLPAIMLAKRKLQ
jgi:O-antigen/teichoic acid export membrane protein